MTEYRGSCHCGAVRLRIAAEITDIYRCDCLLFHIRNALTTSVHEADFSLLAGAEVLSEYNWNTGVARHFFCSRWGIYPFHRTRTMPDHCGVNVSCLEGFDPSALGVRQAEGMTAAPDGARDVWPGLRRD